MEAGGVASYRAVSQRWEARISPAVRDLLMSFLEKSSVKLSVGRLSYHMTDQDLADLFGQYGQVLSATVILDRETGRSKGFGFVEMSNVQEARAAMHHLNNALLAGRTIIVNEARDQQESRGRDRRPGGGRDRYRESRYYVPLFMRRSSLLNISCGRRVRKECGLSNNLVHPHFR